MNFIRSKGFKYLINLLFGVGAAVVMIGALSKLAHIEIPPFSSTTWLILGLGTEALLFFVQGLIPPQPDYYWEKLYPGLDGDGTVDGVAPIVSGQSFDASSGITAQLDEVLDNANVNQLSIERLGNNLALLSENIEKMNEVADLGAANKNFVDQATSATSALHDVEGQMHELKHSVSALRLKYDEMLSAMKN